jgi:RHS repeat-associated protein
LSVGTFADVGATSHHDSIAYTAIFRYGVDLNNSYIDHFLLDEHDAGGVKTAQFPSMPTRPRARAVFPGTVVLNVAASSTVTISSTTAYAAIDVGEGAVLNLQSGDYPIDLLTVRDNARLTALGPVTVRVARRVFGGEGARLTVASGLSAKDLRIEALGKNGGAGLPGSLPQAIDLDDLSTAQAILFAPNGTVRLGKLSETTGAVIARDVFLDERAELTYQDGLAPLSGSLPLAFNDEYGATEDQPLVIDAEGVLLNDLDPSYATLTATITAFTVNGTVAFASDGGFVYTPNENFEGEDHFSYIAIGPGGESVTATVTILVDGTNDVPVISSFPAGSTFVGSVWQYTVECEDPDDGDTLEYALIDAPSGVSLTGNVLSFTPSSTDIGELELEVSCTDSQDAYDTQHVSFTVLAAPGPESFVLYAKHSLQFRGTAVDGSVGVLESSAYPGPRAVIAGVAVVGEVPGAALFADSVLLQAGSHVQDIYAGTLTDYALVRGEHFDFPAMPPFPSVSSVTPGTGTLTLTANTQQTISNSPSWSAFDVGADACLFLQPGTYHVDNVTVATGGCIAALGPIELRIAGRLLLGDYAYIGPAEGMSTGPSGVRIEVSGYNNGMDVLSMPVAAETRTQASIIGTLIVPNGTAVFGWRTAGWGAFFAKDIFANDNSIFFKGASDTENTQPVIVSTPRPSIDEGSVYTYQIGVSDTPNDEHQYFLDAAPGAMSVSASGLLSWTPDNDDVGVHMILVRVRDMGGLEDTQSFQLTVININSAPAFTSSPPTSADEDVLYTYSPAATDPDGTTPTITLVESQPGMTFNAGVLSWRPSQAQVGTRSVVLAATDGTLTATQAFHIVVHDVNDAPSFSSSPPTSAVEDQLYTFAVRGTDPDPEEILTFSLLNGPAGMLLLSASNIVQWTPNNDDVGEHAVSIEVRDSAHATALLDFLVTVTNANDPPVFTSTSSVSATENQQLTHSVMTTDPDPADNVTYAIDSAPEGAELNGSTLTWTPSDEQVGTFSMTFRATDTQGAVAIQRFTVVVGNVNDAPEITSEAVTTATEDQTYRYDVEATDKDREETLTYSLVSPPSGMTIAAATGEINWSMPQAGNHEITVEVTDGEADVEQVYTLVVQAVNDAPMVINLPPLHATQGTLYTFVPEVVDELPNWTLHLDVSPLGMSVVDRALIWTPSSTQVGPFAVIIRVADAEGEIDLLSFTVNVANTNDPPIFITTAPALATENQLYQYQAMATDPDGDGVTYALVDGPLHLSVSPSGLVSWRPATQQIGNHEVTLSATDGDASPVTQTWLIAVAGVECGSGESSARCSSLAWSHVMTREGVPLGGVTIQQGGIYHSLSDASTGMATLGGGLAGSYNWELSVPPNPGSPRYVPVYRQADLAEEEITWVPSVRMTPLVLSATIATSGGTIELPGLELVFPIGSFTAPSPVYVAILDGQSLPAFLPRGWSPAAAFWMEVGGALSEDVGARFTLPAALPENAVLVLAGFHRVTHQWTVVSQVTATNPLSTSPTVEIELGDYEGHAVLVADAGMTIPANGAPLSQSSDPLPSNDVLAASGAVVPEYQMASEDVEDMTGQARVILSYASALPSGIVLPGRMFETYAFADGKSMEVPFLDLGVVFYRYPGVEGAAAGSLSATFPVRPRHLLAPSEGTDIHQRINMVSALTFSGVPVDALGGVIAQEGISLTFPSGGFSGHTLVSLSVLPVDAVELARTGTVLAFRVDWSGGQLDNEATIQLDATVPRDRRYVLARQETADGRTGWAPIERFSSDTNGVLQSSESGQHRLPGLTVPGSYALFAADVPEYVVYGQITANGGSALEGAIVEVDGRPWFVRSDAAGDYATLAFPGEVDAHAHRAGSTDNGSNSGELFANVGSLNLSMVIRAQAPRVTRTNPRNDEVVSIISAVEVFFSEPILRSSLSANAIILEREDGTVVEGAQSLRPDGRSRLFLPTDPLDYDAEYEFEVSAALRDLDQNLIEGTRAFEFATETRAARPTGAARLISYGPGVSATPCHSNPNFPSNDLSLTCVEGLRGTADPHVPVILVNEDTGVTATTVSEDDGSFVSWIRGREEDLLSAVFVNQNGTRFTVPLEMQMLSGNRTALYSSGGVIAVENPLGGDPLELIIEPGAITRRGVFQMMGHEPEDMVEFNQEVEPQHEGEALDILIGATVSYTGSPMTQSADIRFPIDEDDLNLPWGEEPHESGYVLAAIREIRVNGQPRIVYETIDRAEYEPGGVDGEGALATHSFPMPGLFLGPLLYGQLHIVLLRLPDAPYAITGRVYQCPLDARDPRCETMVDSYQLPTEASLDGPLPEGGRRIAGATIFATAAAANDNFATPGAVTAGQLTSTSDGVGRYTLAVPFMSQGAYAVHGTHPDYAPQQAIARVEIWQAGGAQQSDLVFRSVPGEGNPAPTLMASHSPRRPQPFEDLDCASAPASARAEVRVVLTPETAVLELPEVIQASPLTAEAVVAGDLVVCNGILYTDQPGDRRQATFSVLSPVPAAARLRIRAIANNKTAEIAYAITFGGSSDVSPSGDSLEVNDESGPRVHRTIPTMGGAASNGAPIKIELNEELHPAIDNNAVLVASMSNGIALEQSVVLGADRRSIEVSLTGLEPGQEYSLTLTDQIRDVEGHIHDQDPILAGEQMFVFQFRSPLQSSSNPNTLDEVQMGGGAVTHGGYAYVLDRTQGGFHIYDLSNNTLDPQHVVFMPLEGGYPRDLMVIPSYSYVRRGRGAPCDPAFERVYTASPGDCVVENRTLLLIIGGRSGGGYGNGWSGQYLRMFDISNPRSMRVMRTTAIAPDPMSTVSQIRWSPPDVTYLEQNFSLTTINAFNLQTYILGLEMTAEEFRIFDPLTVPSTGTSGTDLNGDGDYVDQDEVLPTPGPLVGGVVGMGFAGKHISVGATTTLQPVIDYQYDPARNYLGAVLGNGRAPGGAPESYRTFRSGGISVSPVAANFPFPNDILEALAYLPDQSIRMREGEEDDPNGGVQVSLDLAVIGAYNSVPGPSGLYENVSKIFLLDISNVNAPALIGIQQGIRLPESLGQIRKIEEDRFLSGILRVSMSSDVLLIDLNRMTMEQPASGQHPAIVSIISGAGTSQNAEGASSFGVQVLADTKQVIFTGPEMFLVSFPHAGSLVSPRPLVNQPDSIREILARVQLEDALRPSRIRPEGQTFGAERVHFTSDITPPSLATHFAGLIFAPGSAGEIVNLMFEAVNDTGTPHKNPGPGFAPLRAASARALELSGDGATAEESSINVLQAVRLSSDPASTYYNVYLTDPFAMVYQSVTQSQLNQLRTVNGNPREIFHSMDGARLSIDAAIQSNNVLAPFASTVSETKDIQSGSVLETTGYAVPRIVGPNPRSIVESMSVPGTDGRVAQHNGETRFETTDLSLPSPQLPLVFRRSYVGQDLSIGVFGPGFDFNYNQRVIRLKEGSVLPGVTHLLVDRGELADSRIGESQDLVFHDGLGNVILFKYVGEEMPSDYAGDPLVQPYGASIDAYYLPETGVFDAMFRLRGGEYRRITPQGTVYTYNPSGLLETITHRYERNKTKLIYSSTGDLEAIQDHTLGASGPDVRRIELGYYRESGNLRGALDETTTEDKVRGRVCRLRDHLGRSVDFKYGSDGLLARVEGVELSSRDVNNATLGRQRVEYYYADNKLVRMDVSRAAGESGSEKQDPELVASLRDGDGRNIAMTGHHGPISMTFASPNTAKNLETNTVDATTADGVTTKTRFSRFGMLEFLERTDASRAAAPPTITTYDQRYLVKSVTYPLENSVHYEYHHDHPNLRSRGNLKKITRRDGPRSSLPEMTLEMLSYHAAYNFPIGSLKDFEDNTFTIAPTPDEKNIGSIGQGALAESYHYNSVYGELEQHISFEGVQQNWIYSQDSRFLNVHRRGEETTTFVVDSCLTGGFGPKLGLPCLVVSGLGSETESTDYAYDELGRNTGIIHGAQETDLRYDIHGNVRRVDSLTDSGKRVIETRAIDKQGFLEGRTQQLIDGANSESLHWSYGKDAAGRVASETPPGASGPSTTLSYSLAESVTTMGDVVTRSFFDQNGNQERQTTTSEGGAIELAWTYDGFDRVTETTDGKQRTTLQLSKSGHVDRAGITPQTGGIEQFVYQVTSRDPLGRPTAWSVDQKNYTATYQIGSLGLDVHTVLPGGLTRTEHFSRAGRSELDRIPNLYSVDTAFDSAGRVKRESRADGTAATYVGEQEYEAGTGFLKRVRDSRGVPLVEYEHRYDGTIDKSTTSPAVLALETTIHRSAAGEYLGTTSEKNVSNVVTLDEQRRRQREGRSSSVFREYGYDSSQRINARTEADGTLEGYSQFHPTGQPKVVSTPMGLLHLDYDSHGNLTTRSGPQIGTQTFGYDALDRLLSTSFTGGSMTFGYVLGGKSSAALWLGANRFDWSLDQNSNGYPTDLSYPTDGVKAIAVRTAGGQLSTMGEGDSTSLIASASYATLGAFDELRMGPAGAIRRKDHFDYRRRLSKREYTVNGIALSDVRYQYDDANRETARQEYHQNARTNAYSYDEDSRLKSADVHARPGVPEELTEFPWAGVRGEFKSGDYRRDYTYDQQGLDVIEDVSIFVWPNENAPAVGASFETFDELGFAATVDGFTRAQDAVGNTATLQLDGTTATLSYNELSQLIRVQRADGKRIDYTYRSDGPLATKVVTCPTPPGSCVRSNRIYVYDGMRLLEEHETSSGVPVLQSRYYYADEGEVPFAADFRVGGTMERHFLVADRMGSITGVLAENGAWVERVKYDPWGRPTFESFDGFAPEIKEISVESTGALLVEWTEPVLPAVVASSTSGRDLATSYASLADMFTVMTGTISHTAEAVFVESLAGRPRGTVLRVVPSGTFTSTAPAQLVVDAGRVFDSWSNSNSAASVTFRALPSTRPYVRPSSLGTNVPAEAQSQVRNAVLFQSHIYDHETGLYLMRARAFDPRTGSFLQRDPMGYEGSVNHYAGIGHNTVNYRDPSGALPEKDARQYGARIMANAEWAKSYTARTGDSSVLTAKEAVLMVKAQIAAPFLAVGLALQTLPTLGGIGVGMAVADATDSALNYMGIRNEVVRELVHDATGATIGMGAARGMRHFLVADSTRLNLRSAWTGKTMRPRRSQAGMAIIGGPKRPPSRKIFKNLFPEEDTPTAGLVLGLVEEDGRFFTVNSRGFKTTAKRTYTFVVELDGNVVVGRRAPKGVADVKHLRLSYGADVLYAGQVRFTKKGILRSWNNFSGHYQPGTEWSDQAPFDLSHFAGSDDF